MFGLSKRMWIVIGLLVVVVIVFALQNGKNGSASGSSGSSTGQCQVQVSADVLNVRATPNDNGKVVGKLSTGTVTQADKTVQNGFRQLGDNRWVSNQFVKAVSGAC